MQSAWHYLCSQTPRKPIATLGDIALKQGEQTLLNRGLEWIALGVDNADHHAIWIATTQHYLVFLTDKWVVIITAK